MTIEKRNLCIFRLESLHGKSSLLERYITPPFVRLRRYASLVASLCVCLSFFHKLNALV